MATLLGSMSTSSASTPTNATTPLSTTTTGSIDSMSTSSALTPTSATTPSTTAGESISAPVGTPSADIALIAGAAGGGAAALLLLVGVAIFFVCRSRKPAAAPAAPAGNQHGNYGAVGLVQAPGNEYDVGDMSKLPPNEYGLVRVAAEPRYSDPGVLQAGGIQVKQTGVGTEYSAL